MTTQSSPHWSFWVISAIALVWNALGGVNYIMQMNPDFVATLPDTHKAIINGRPAWATGGFALGVFGGAIGALLLLLRKTFANTAFMISLAGIFVTMIHTTRLAFAGVPFTGFEVFMMILMPIIVGTFLLWYAKRAESKGWIS